MTAVETPFWSLVDASGDCWLWTGSTNRDGYGILSDRSRHTLAHRKAYELLIGPADTDLDHLCRNRACVNPDHLEPVAHRVNVLRGESPPAWNARKTHCKHGHEFTDANTYRPPGGYRTCRTCRRELKVVARAR